MNKTNIEYLPSALNTARSIARSYHGKLHFGVEVAMGELTIEAAEQDAIELQREAAAYLGDDESFLEIHREAALDLDGIQGRNLINAFRANDDAELGRCVRKSIECMAELYAQRDMENR